MSAIIIQTRANLPTGPIPAVGKHAEMLADLQRETIQLLQLLACERSGIFDGTGERFWIDRDAVLAAAEKLVFLAQQRGGAIPRG